MTVEPRRVETAAETAIAERMADRAVGPFAGQRLAAAARLAASGLPGRRVEAYRYTDLRAGLRSLAPAAGPADIAVGRALLEATFPWVGMAAKRIVFVDGRYSAALSDLDGLDGAVEVVPIAAALAAGDGRLAAVGDLAERVDDAVVALNTGFFDDGALVRIAAGATVAAPLALVHIVAAVAPVSLAVRHVVAVGEGATVRLLESHAGPDGVAYQANTLVELAVGAGARVTWARLQEEGEAALHLGSLVTAIAAGGRLDHLSVSFGAALARQQGFVRFVGPDGRAAFETAVHVDGRRHIDSTIVVDHLVPDCVSTERFRSVVADDATSVVQGRINVAQAAQRTDARMMTQAILTGDGAEAINKPELEIFADDVQCAHGATAGRLDETALTYMRTRGIPKPVAEAMLLEAFLADTIERLPDEPVAEALKARLAARLAARGGA